MGHGILRRNVKKSMSDRDFPVRIKISNIISVVKAGQSTSRRALGTVMEVVTGSPLTEMYQKKHEHLIVQNRANAYYKHD